MIAKIPTKKLEDIIDIVRKAYQKNISATEESFIKDSKEEISKYLELPDLFNCK